MALVSASQADHIKINAGNVLTVTLLAVLGVAATGWTSAMLSSLDIPVLSQLAVGAQYTLKGF